MHEKSILLPLLPVTALAAWEPVAAALAPLVAAFSMYPLLERDGLALPYAACLAIYAAAMHRLLPRNGSGGGEGAAKTRAARSVERPAGPTAAVRAAAAGGVISAVALHAARALLSPPERLPWLWDRAFVSLAFVYAACGMAYFNWRQWNQPACGELAGSSVAAAAQQLPKPATGSNVNPLGRRGLVTAAEKSKAA